MAHEEPKQPDAGGAAPSGPKSKLPLIAAIVAGIAVGAGSGVMVAGPMFARKFTAQHAAAASDSSGTEEAATEDGGKDAKAEGGDHEGGKGGAAAAAPPVLTLENLVLNPSGSNGSRYLLMTLAIECKDAKGVESLTLRDPELRDLILNTLGKKSVEELSDIAQRDQIKTEILNALSERFGKATVKQLYFPQFVIQ
jgi:flagellar FliL protein